MDRVISAKVFVAIAERGSLSAASKALDMSRSMVTRYLSSMEYWADARLLHRSTRSLSLTSAGESVLQHCRRLVEIAEQVPSASSDAEKGAHGILRVSCAQFLGQDVLMPIVKNYLQQHAKVSIDMHISNETVDLVAERIDLAIRVSNNLDPNLIARSLGECNSVVCASPEFLENHGKPSKPEDLASFNCLSYSYFGSNDWQFGKDNEHTAVPVSGNFSANESGVLLQATLAGMGISLLPKLSVLPYLSTGKLEVVLAKYRPMVLGIHGVYRSRNHMPLALRSFIDTLVGSLSKLQM